MADDRPLTSEEMIRKAREDLSQASSIPMPDVEEGTADLDPADDPDSDDPEPFTAAGAQRSRRALKRSRPPLPPDPFSDSSPTRRQQGRPRTAAIIISLVVAVLGIAVLLATTAANAP